MTPTIETTEAKVEARLAEQRQKNQPLIELLRRSREEASDEDAEEWLTFKRFMNENSLSSRPRYDD